MTPWLVSSTRSHPWICLSPQSPHTHSSQAAASAPLSSSAVPESPPEPSFLCPRRGHGRPMKLKDTRSPRSQLCGPVCTFGGFVFRAALASPHTSLLLDWNLRFHCKRGTYSFPSPPASIRFFQQLPEAGSSPKEPFDGLPGRRRRLSFSFWRIAASSPTSSTAHQGAGEAGGGCCVTPFQSSFLV